MNKGDYLSLFEQIKRGPYNSAGTRLTNEDRDGLRRYPGKLEEIGALMLAGKFSRREIYKHFGDEILTTNDAEFLWEDEDPHYWKVFQLLVDEMKRERTTRTDTQANKT